MGKFNYYKFRSRVTYLILLFIGLSLLLLQLCTSVSAAVCFDDRGGIFNNTFDPSNYEKDNNQKHIFLNWKSADGAFYDSNARLFYKIKGAKTFPCQTYQEWLNTKQFVADSVKTGISFIPGAGLLKGAIKAIPTVVDISGVQDKFIDDTDSKISMFNDVVNHSLEINLGRVFFFFDENEIDKIKDIHITFCQCSNDVGLVGCITDLITPENIFDDDIDDVKDLDETALTQTLSVGKKATGKFIQKTIAKTIKQKVGHTIAKQAWKKTTKKGIGMFFGKILVPGFDVAYDKIDRKSKATKDIVKTISFDPQRVNNEKIIGFVICFPNPNQANVYGITPNKKFVLIASVVLDESIHLLVDLIVSKDGLNPSIIPTLYAGKLKK